MNSSMPGHVVEMCACGAVLRQCRCPGPKPIRVMPGPCACGSSSTAFLGAVISQVDAAFDAYWRHAGRFDDLAATAVDRATFLAGWTAALASRAKEPAPRADG